MLVDTRLNSFQRYQGGFDPDEPSVIRLNPSVEMAVHSETFQIFYFYVEPISDMGSFLPLVVDSFPYGCVPKSCLLAV